MLGAMLHALAFVSQNTIGHTVPIRYTRLYTGWLVRVLGSNPVPWFELDSNVARVCTIKARVYSVKQGFSRFEHDLQPVFVRLFNGSMYVLVRSCTIKHDFYSIYSTFAGLTYGLADLWSNLNVHVCLI